MRIFDILTQSRPEPPKLVMPIIGFLMASGFCLQNAKFISGLGGEYQPLIFLLGCIIALFFLPIPRPALYASAILLGTSALVILFHRVAFGTTASFADIARLTVGPLIMAGSAAAWNKINSRWLWGILGTYLVFAVWGMLSPESALRLISQLGIRINDTTNPAYFPWSAFFYSEYSYAALAFITLYCWMLARQDLQSHKYLFVFLLALLLLSTRSGTAIPLLLIMAISQLQLRWIVLCLAILVSAYFLSPRVERLSQGLLAIITGDIAAYIQTDGSSAWRLLSNMTASYLMLNYPLGLAQFDLHSYSNLQPLQSSLDEVIRWWLNAFPVVPAQGVAFNYGLFGGWFSFISISGVYLYSCVHSYKTSAKHITLAFVFVAFYALYVQSGLSSVTLWVILGIMLNSPSSVKSTA